MIVAQAPDGRVFKSREKLEDGISEQEKNIEYYSECEDSEFTEGWVKGMIRQEREKLSGYMTVRKDFDLIESLPSRHITVNQQVDTVTGSLTGIKIDTL